MINDSPNFLYSIKVAEVTWKKLVDDINTPEIIAVDNGERILDEPLLRIIIEFFGGNVLDFSEKIEEVDEEIARDAAKRNMEKHISDSFSQHEIKGDSYFVKTSDNHSFEIGYLKYKLMNVIHEFGHACLDIQKAQPKELIWDDGSQWSSETMVNAFARAFVMPRERFLNKVSQYTTRGQCDISKVANSFGVEYMHAYVRGKDLHLWE